LGPMNGDTPGNKGPAKGVGFAVGERGGRGGNQGAGLMVEPVRLNLL
jgi:hypothetical protein